MDKIQEGLSFDSLESFNSFIKEVEQSCGMNFVKAHTGGKNEIFGSLTFTLRCEKYGIPKPRGTGLKPFK